MSQNYTSEFKKKIVRLHLEEGRTYESITAEYGISKSGISKWCAEFSKECRTNPQAKEDYDFMKQNLRLKRENEELRKAKKIAENGGEIVVKKVCPHCGKEFIPTSNRQVFCSKECRYQAEQAGKKAEREAERGDHYYRQRKCAVCGKMFWPNSSVQTFCFEECRKKHYNEYSLEWWHKKQAEKELREVV